MYIKFCADSLASVYVHDTDPCMCGARAVSYTHLDVYKRQIILGGIQETFSSEF